MPRSVPAADIERARLANYSAHFECYTIAKTRFDQRTLELYQTLCQYVSPIRINIFGATERTDAELSALIDLANRYKVEGWFINHFYLTDSGWAEFQEVWNNLPVLVHRPCVQVPKVVPLVHRHSRFSANVDNFS